MEWQSIKEKKPVLNARVLITVEMNKEKMVFASRYYTPYFVADSYGYIPEYKVIAWQPFPDPCEVEP